MASKRATDIAKENCARKDAKTTFLGLFANPKILVQGFHSFLCDFGRFASSKTLRAHCEQLDVVIIEIYIQAVGFDNQPQTHLSRCTRRQKNNLVKALFMQSLKTSLIKV